MNKALLLVILLLCAGIPFALAGDSETSVEGSNYLRWDEGKETDTRLSQFDYPDNTIRRHFVENRLRLDVFYKNLRIGGRLLHFHPSNEDNYRDGLEDVTKIDKRYVEGTVYPMVLRAGDFSDVWAHGLTLSAYENRDLYFDTELDGIHAALNSEPLFITILRGTSRPGIYVRNAELSGGRVNLRFAGQGAGFSYLFMDSGGYAETHVSGLDWRFERGVVTLYGERAWNEVVLNPKSTEGHATYVATVVSKWGWSLLAEYKDYDYIVASPFQNPPTVYRELGPRLLQGREPHVLKPADEIGYQLELSGQATSTTFMTLHWSVATKHSKEWAGIPVPRLRQLHLLKEEDNPYWEVFGNIEQDFPASRHIFLELGSNEEAFVVWQKRMWAWTKFTTPFRGSQELEFQGEILGVTDRRRNDRKFTDGLVGLSWSDGRGLSLAASYEMTDDEELMNREGHGWPSVESAITMGKGKHRLSLGYGRERGGLRCSNGVCRIVQPFTGWRMSLETTL